MIAGVFEGAAMRGPLGVGAGAGFVVLAMLPILFAASVIVRGLWRGWAPVVRSLVAPDGGAPALAAWLAYLVLALVALGFAMFGSTLLLARKTMFRPMVVGYAQPVFGIAAVVVLIALSRPVVRGLTHLLARRGSSLRPRRIAIAFGLLAAVVVGSVGIWARRRIGPLDLAPAMTPLAGVVGMIATHAVLARMRAYAAWTARIATLFAVLFLGCAMFVWRARPNATLEVWGELPVAGFVIDKGFDLEAIRDRIALDAFRPVARANAQHPDIVVIVVDTVRADRTPPYGGTAVMPVLDGLAKRGAVFERALAPSNVTRRSIPSMLTGLTPNHVRGRVVGWALRIDPRHVVLGERLRAGGYDTAGFVCCGGFYGDESRTGLSRGLDTLVVEKDGAKLARAARAWLDQRERLPAATRRPLFMFMHVLEPHNWAGGGDPPYDLAIRMRMYDRTLNQADKVIAEIVGAFRVRDPGSTPIVIVTADHGEALGDHGEPFHSTDLYNSQIHVPFVVAGPGIPTARITETVSLTDLTPTVLELAGFTPPPMDGRSLAPLLTGARASRADGVAFAAMIKDRSNKGGVRAIVRGTWKLIVTGSRRELYDIQADPEEMSDRAAQHPDIVRELAALLAEHD